MLCMLTSISHTVRILLSCTHSVASNIQMQGNCHHSLPVRVEWPQQIVSQSACCRNAVQPDVTFYAALIEVAGAAGKLETAFKISADAKRYKLPQQVSHARSL